ncbi:hypothetical protein T484DRAFT_1953949 [Baffinella frigidus]|nr:hypothetical protein T484DRAFT_1953949 [Cryptophyta sp. CCMP2293]
MLFCIASTTPERDPVSESAAAATASASNQITRGESRCCHSTSKSGCTFVPVSEGAEELEEPCLLSGPNASPWDSLRRSSPGSSSLHRASLSRRSVWASAGGEHPPALQARISCSPCSAYMARSRWRLISRLSMRAGAGKEEEASMRRMSSMQSRNSSQSATVRQRISSQSFMVSVPGSCFRVFCSRTRNAAVDLELLAGAEATITSRWRLIVLTRGIFVVGTALCPP